MGYPNPRQVPSNTPLDAIERIPGSFVIPVSDTQAYKQFGNSVVVPVVRHLGMALAEQLRQPARLRAAS